MGKPTKISVKNFIVDNFSEMSKRQGNNTNINNTEFSDTNLILSSEEKQKEDRLGLDKSPIGKAEILEIYMKYHDTSKNYDIINIWKLCNKK